ncbi:MAG: peptidoglycan DD-metalloendopeptidase family protein [Bdellovibrionaceae bacterium]|nr:peptidoglycan DD-metalloendopeptidase family protein [Pseudobdellovibrionaceae bacterium]
MIMSIFLFFSIQAKGSIEKVNDKSINEIKSTYLTSKQKMLDVEQKERGVLGSLYNINQKMKKMSKNRDQLTNKMLSAKSNAKNTARDIALLEERIVKQRAILSKKLRVIYKLRSSGILPVLFSSHSSHDLDRILKYLKAYSESDYELILNYQKNMNKLNKKRVKLETEVKRLVEFKKDLKEQEVQLEVEQKIKSKILTKISDTKKAELKKLKNVRKLTRNIIAHNSNYSLSELLDESFFAIKGNLEAPVKGTLVKDYGVIQHPNFNFKLSHKGYFYRTDEKTPVKIIHKANISFVGYIKGYGMTVIADHGDHFYTVYAHMSKALVTKNQTVEKGFVIGESGESSSLYGQGVYFEIRHFSDSIDPKNWLVTKDQQGN